MRLLLDTCALSELHREQCAPSALKLLDSTRDEDLFISVVTIGELQKGITLLAPSRRKQDLEGWISAIEALHFERILPIGRDTARIWGEVTARCQLNGYALGAADGLIAATAVEHGLHIFTRNSRDFEPTGAMIIDPWKS
jgi:predicted nucleic acid-binding protein